MHTNSCRKSIAILGVCVEKIVKSFSKYDFIYCKTYCRYVFGSNTDKSSKILAAKV